jgi:abequosyltransferase
MAQATEDVELVIVDGASTDNTEAVIRGFMSQFPRLHYHRLEQKGGVDKDYDLAVGFAQGEYCWLLSDDDPIRAGAVQTILAAIEHEFSLILVNSEIWNADLTHQIQPKVILTDVDRVYSQPENERFFAEMGAYITFIGCVVIRRDLWMQRERVKYYSTEFIHFGVIFQQPLPGRILVVERPLISIRYGNASWTARSFRIWMFKWPDLVWSFGHFSESSRSRVCAREPWHHARILLSYRAAGAYSIREYDSLLKGRIRSAWFRLQALVIAGTPGFLANGLFLVYLTLRRPDAGVALINLRNSPFYYRKILGWQ